MLVKGVLLCRKPAQNLEEQLIIFAHGLLVCLGSAGWFSLGISLQLEVSCGHLWAQLSWMSKMDAHGLIWQTRMLAVYGVLNCELF